MSARSPVRNGPYSVDSSSFVSVNPQICIHCIYNNAKKGVALTRKAGSLIRAPTPKFAFTVYIITQKRGSLSQPPFLHFVVYIWICTCRPQLWLGSVYHDRVWALISSISCHWICMCRPPTLARISLSRQSLSLDKPLFHVLLQAWPWWPKKLSLIRKFVKNLA